MEAELWALEGRSDLALESCGGGTAEPTGWRRKWEGSPRLGVESRSCQGTSLSTPLL